ncbi:hypothetical protein Arub01_57840 [Actinomadura rubrobrunea]|uniref:Sigma-70 family RNA polymerase sigma factor n=1 Tax=Actinomadura rubrobrunea TaxID=115335 RepID=A0A9W6Q2G7_9ACTN|nr:sigma factor [Actinomadura rubrobrunea]GLW67541.1 hypothetical protein Arub01_57840 [Actinomadura rubrobrunea]
MPLEPPSERSPDDAAAVAFDQHRDLLLSVAHSMLGHPGEAEDLVREVGSRWLDDSEPGAHRSKAALIRLVTSAAIARLRTAQVSGESHIGPWIPEPLLGEPLLSLAESVSAAMAVVLDALQPNERTVFVLRHGFGLTDDAIAKVTGLREQDVRRIAADATARVRCEVPAVGGGTLRRLKDSLSARDRRALLDKLTDDVVLTRARAGGSGPPLRIEGRENVADALLECFAAASPDTWSEVLDAEGIVVLLCAGEPTVAAAILQLSDAKIKEIDILESAPEAQ